MLLALPATRATQLVQWQPDVITFQEIQMLNEDSQTSSHGYARKLPGQQTAPGQHDGAWDNTIHQNSNKATRRDVHRGANDGKP
jgi:exonuclease III